MTREEHVRTLFDYAGQLTMSNDWYREQVEHYVLGALRFDGDDITTAALPEKKVTATVIAKEEGVIAGVQEVSVLPIEVDWKVQDGQRVGAGETLANVRGTMHEMLRVERTFLNTLQRMSGIATATADVVARTGDTLVCATRKTLWAALDKRAVSLGGGATHRLGLWDGVMVKDNHIDAVGGVGGLATVDLPDVRLREIEAATPEQAREIMNAELSFSVMMLDNFSLAEIESTLAWARENKHDYFFEASGGITPENAAIYAATGVDAISLGALTHSARALDISLNIV